MNAVATNLCALEEREGFEPSVLSLVRLISSRPCGTRTPPEPAWLLEDWMRAQCAKRLLCAQLDKISPTSGRLEYRRIRPVPEAMSGAAFTHFSKTNIGPILAALPSGLSGVVPTILLNDVLHKTACASLIAVIH